MNLETRSGRMTWLSEGTPVSSGWIGPMVAYPAEGKLRRSRPATATRGPCAHEATARVATTLGKAHAGRCAHLETATADYLREHGRRGSYRMPGIPSSDAFRRARGF